MGSFMHERLLTQHNISGLNGTLSLPQEELVTLVQTLLERVEAVERNIDFAWIITSTIGILSMQAGTCLMTFRHIWLCNGVNESLCPGFTLLEVGTVQSKNVKSVLLKNACDLLFGKISKRWKGITYFCRN